MSNEQFTYRPLVDLIPKGVLRQIEALPVVEAGFGAGPGFVAVKRWQYDPPVSLQDAVVDLESHRELMRRCHLVFLDGSRLVMDRHQFLLFEPSVALRRKSANAAGPNGTKVERFRFSDFDEWPETLADDVRAFRQVHGIAPNLLATSRQVFIEMDNAVQSEPEMVVNDKGEHPSGGEGFEISGFLVDDCEVVFVIADTIRFPEYLLQYDPDPGFDGEPFVIPGTNVLTRTRKVG